MAVTMATGMSRPSQGSSATLPFVRSWLNSEVSECAPHVRLLRYTGSVRRARETAKMTQSGYSQPRLNVANEYERSFAQGA
jgi:hypothetical protein